MNALIWKKYLQNHMNEKIIPLKNCTFVMAIGGFNHLDAVGEVALLFFL